MRYNMLTFLANSTEDPIWGIVKIVLAGMAIIIGFSIVMAYINRYAFIRYGVMIAAAIFLIITAFKSGYNFVNWSEKSTWNVLIKEIAACFFFLCAFFCDVAFNSYYEWEGRVVEHFFSEPEYIEEYKEKDHFWSVVFSCFVLAFALVAFFTALLSDIVYGKNSHILLGWFGVALLVIIALKFIGVVIKIRRNS